MASYEEEARSMAHILDAAQIIKGQHDAMFAEYFKLPSDIMEDAGGSPDQRERAARVMRRAYDAGAAMAASSMVGTAAVHLAALGSIAELNRLGLRMQLLADFLTPEDEAESDQE